jgi:signal transduction histidine kinase
MGRGHRERALRALNSFAAEIADCTESMAVCERTVEAADAVLDFGICVVNLESDGLLEVRAISDSTPPEDVEPMAVDEGLVGLTYRTGESYLVADLEEMPAAEPKGPYRSAVSVPVGDRGTFQTVAETPDAFDETDVELAELLSTHCAAALDRIERAEELRERTRQLERQNRRLDRFAGVVSHDLRNPLSVMDGYIDLAERTGEPEHFERCRRAVGRMRTLTDDLLTLAREGSSIDEVESVSLSSVAADCWETVRTDDAALEVVADYAFTADRARTGQVLENLFRNAVEHGSTSPPSQAREDAVEHGSTSPPSQAQEDAGSENASEPSVAGAPDDAVEHSSTSPPSHAREDAVEHGGDDATVVVGPLADGEGFFVADDGPGIPEADREAVFDAGVTTRDSGTGVGLSIVETVAEAHGWSVAITESADGGARFEFTGATPA